MEGLGSIEVNSYPVHVDQPSDDDARLGENARLGDHANSADDARFDALLPGIAAEMAARDAAGDDVLAADLALAEVAQVGLLDRIRAVESVVIEVIGHAAVGGRVLGVGRDVVLLRADDAEWAIPLWGMGAVVGLSASAVVPASARDRLGFSAILREWADAQAPVRLARVGAAPLTGTIDRVGRDHLDLAEHDPGEPRRPGSVRRIAAVPLGAISGMSRR